MKITGANEILLKKSKQLTSGRPVWMVMELIKIYREHHSQGSNLQQACNLVNDFCKKVEIEDVSRKTLDEYWSTIQKAYNLGFDFDHNQYEQYGTVKNFVSIRQDLSQKKTHTEEIFTKDKKDALVDKLGLLKPKLQVVKTDEPKPVTPKVVQKSPAP